MISSLTPTQQRARLALLEEITSKSPRKLTNAMVDERNELFRALRAAKAEQVELGRTLTIAIPPGFTFTISDRPAHGYEVFLALSGSSPGANASARGDDPQALIDALVPEVLARHEHNQKVIEEKKTKIELERQAIRALAARPIGKQATSGADLLDELGL